MTSTTSGAPGAPTGGRLDDYLAGEHGVLLAARAAKRAKRHERDSTAEALRKKRSPAAVGEVE